MKRLVILVSSSDFSTDPRIYKQAFSARDDGWDVTVCCYSNFDCYSESVEEGCKIIRIPYAPTIRRIPGMPTSLLKDIVARVIYRHKQYKLNLNDTDTRPFKSLFTITDRYGTYLWATVLYGFAQLHFYTLVLEHRADVYHSTDLITLLTGSLLKLTRRGKLVYDSHEMWIESMEDYSPTMKKLISFYERLLIRYTDAVTTVNIPIAKELAKRYRILQPTVVMNTPQLQPELIKKDHSNIRVIYQGRYTYNRGIEDAIVGINKVDGVTLYMRGIDAYGKHEPYVTKLKEINDKTVFLPPVDMRDLVSSLDGYDIGIVPYIGNNFNNLNASPNKIFEYMMAGLAVIASDLPVLSDVITRCGCGATYKQGDPDDLARVLKEMILNLNEYKRNARRCAEQEFNWNIQGKKLIDSYNSLL